MHRNEKEQNRERRKELADKLKDLRKKIRSGNGGKSKYLFFARTAKYPCRKCWRVVATESLKYRVCKLCLGSKARQIEKLVEKLSHLGVAEAAVNNLAFELITRQS